MVQGRAGQGVRESMEMTGASTQGQRSELPRPPGDRVGGQNWSPHLVLLAGDVALVPWGQLTLHLGLQHHLAVLQLHHTLTISWAVLGAEGMAVGQLPS